MKENELKKNIEIEIEKEFLTKYLESESEDDEKSEEDEDLITQMTEEANHTHNS